MSDVGVSQKQAHGKRTLQKEGLHLTFTCCVFFILMVVDIYLHIYVYIYQLAFIVFLRREEALFTVYSVHLCKYVMENAGHCNLFNRHISK